ncbi:MAG: HAMP domain-containing sensor histidine kinase [Polyangiales bacterium]
MWRHRHPRPRPFAHPGCEPEHPVKRYMKARMHRRLFAAFAGAIALSMTVAALVVGALHDTNLSWRDQTTRAAAFTQRRFAEVWRDPPRRDALAQDMARDLRLEVTLLGVARDVTFTPEGRRPASLCRRPLYRASVPTAEGEPGVVVVCATPPRNGLRSFFIPLGAAALVLWLLAGKLARTMTRPITALVDVVDAIGEGKLDRRAQLHPHHAGELGALARSVNTMAERIERQVEQQRELLAVVSHEIRSPLARMRFLLETLRDEGPADPQAVDELEREMQGIDALVGDLLASSRMDFGALRKVAADVCELSTRALERAELSPDALRCEVEGSVSCDPALVACALDNLLANAKKHGGAARALRVTGDARAVTFAVDDAGAGFAPEELTRVFEPFYRGDDARKGQRPGVGLGLALVKRIAEVHGGTAKAENLADGGARVSITLPRALAEPDSP